MNEQNLVPFTEMSEEQHKKIAAKGGRQKGINSKKRKSLAEMAQVCLGLKLPDGNTKTKLKELGLKQSDLTWMSQMVMAQIIKASKGDTRAYNAILSTVQPKIILQEESMLGVQEEDNVSELINVLQERKIKGLDDEV